MLKNSHSLKSCNITNFLSSVCYFNFLPLSSNYLSHFLILFRNKREAKPWVGPPVPSLHLLLTCPFSYFFLTQLPDIPFSVDPFLLNNHAYILSIIKNNIFSLTVLNLPSTAFPLLLHWDQTHVKKCSIII